MAAAAMQTAMLAPAPPAGPGMTAAPAIRGPSASPPPGPSAASPAAAKAEPPKAPASKPAVEQAQFLAEAQARLQKQLEARAGFVERLVAFWSNHFAVSVAKSGELRAAAGPFEREAIRPHALGKFSALLGAAESHPAMILYLDNQNSIGPDAAPGKFAGRGLNENLAREIMELHTLGVGSGYTQADVAEFARGLTGWSVAGPDSEFGAPGGFAFKPNWHEPGPRKILGKTYAEAGVEQGRAILDDLARHPATARHIATKLVRHFVADDPAPDLVAMLAKRSQDSDGDLAVVASALVSDDRAWVAPRVKDPHAPRNRGRRGPRDRLRPARPRVLSAGAQSPRHAAVAAVRPERLSRHERRVGVAGRDEGAARHRLGHGPADAGRRRRSPS